MTTTERNHLKQQTVRRLQSTIQEEWPEIGEVKYTTALRIFNSMKIEILQKKHENNTPKTNPTPTHDGHLNIPAHYYDFKTGEYTLDLMEPLKQLRIDEQTQRISTTLTKILHRDTYEVDALTQVLHPIIKTLLTQNPKPTINVLAQTLRDVCGENTAVGELATALELGLGGLDSITDNREENLPKLKTVKIKDDEVTLINPYYAQNPQNSMNNIRYCTEFIEGIYQDNILHNEDVQSRNQHSLGSLLKNISRIIAEEKNINNEIFGGIAVMNCEAWMLQQKTLEGEKFTLTIE